MYGVPGIPMIGGGQAGVPPVSFELPKNVFRFGEQTLWSSLFLPAAAPLANGVNRVFTTPLGQQGQGFGQALSIAETNLKEGGRIPSGIAFDCFGISVSVGTTNNDVDAAGSTNATPIATANRIGNLNNIITNSVITWDFTQTQIDVCPTNLAGAGGGAFGALAQVTATGAGALTTTGTLQNGNGSVWLYRKHPVALPGNSTFSMLVRFGSRAPALAAAAAGNGSVIVRVVLLGYYKNVVEIA